MKAAANHTAFKVQIGSALASSTASESQRQLLQLRVDLDMDGPSAHCFIELADGTPPAPGDAVELQVDVSYDWRCIASNFDYRTISGVIQQES